MKKHFSSIKTVLLTVFLLLITPAMIVFSRSDDMGKIKKMSKNIVIIAIDQNTLLNFSSQGIQWPFPWKYYARFTDCLTSGKPSSIFFDIYFESHPPDQGIFAKSIEKSGRVYLAYGFSEDMRPGEFQDDKKTMDTLGRTKFQGNTGNSSAELFHYAEPVNSLISLKAKGTGFDNIIPDADGISRRIPLVTKYKGFYYPNIDLLLVMDYYGISSDDVEVNVGHYIRLKNVSLKKTTGIDKKKTIDIPIDENGFMAVKFIGGAGSFTTLSFCYFSGDDLATMENNDTFKDKICLIGSTIVTDQDAYTVPVYGIITGIEYHANVISTILSEF